MRENKTCIKRVDDIALENGFNDVEELGDQRRIIETFFADTVEPELTQLLSQIIELSEMNPFVRESDYLALPMDDRIAFSAQMSFQYTRTKEYRNRFVNGYNQVKEGFPWAPIPEYSKKDFRTIHTMDMLSFSSSNFFANLFDDRHWLFLVNHTKVPFITSDAPIIQINHHTGGERSVSPVSPRATMFFPLSPILAIELYHKSILKEDMKYFDIYQRNTVNWYNYNEIENCTRVALSNESFETMRYLEVDQNDKT